MKDKKKRILKKIYNNKNLIKLRNKEIRKKGQKKE